jgi:hypothetical protein
MSLFGDSATDQVEIKQSFDNFSSSKVHHRLYLDQIRP